MNSGVLLILPILLFTLSCSAESGREVSGEEKWRISANPDAILPQEDGGLLLLEGNDLKMLDENGNEIWRLEDNDWSANSPGPTPMLNNLQSAGDSAYVMAVNHRGIQLVEFNQERGELKITELEDRKLGTDISAPWVFWSANTLSPHTAEQIIAVSRGTDVLALDHDSNELWRFRTGNRLNNVIPGPQNSILVDSYDGWLYCLERDGSLRWKIANSGNGQAAGDDWIACLDEEGIVCLDPQGEVLWKQELKQDPLASVVCGFDDCILLFQQKQTTCYVLTGEVRWQRDFSKGGSELMWMSRLSSDGHIFLTQIRRRHEGFLGRRNTSGSSSSPKMFCLQVNGQQLYSMIDSAAMTWQCIPGYDGLIYEKDQGTQELVCYGPPDGVSQ